MDPERTDIPMERVRERLAASDLLQVGGRRRHAPPPEDVAAARRRAGGGTTLSDLVISDR